MTIRFTYGHYDRKGLEGNVRFDPCIMDEVEKAPVFTLTTVKTY